MEGIVVKIENAREHIAILKLLAPERQSHVLMVNALVLGIVVAIAVGGIGELVLMGILQDSVPATQLSIR